jgi:hypothetical protein
MSSRVGKADLAIVPFILILVPVIYYWNLRLKGSKLAIVFHLHLMVYDIPVKSRVTDAPSPNAKCHVAKGQLVDAIIRTEYSQECDDAWSFPASTTGLHPPRVELQAFHGGPMFE